MAFRFVAADNDKSECLFCFVYLNEAIAMGPSPP